MSALRRARASWRSVILSRWVGGPAPDGGRRTEQGARRRAVALVAVVLLGTACSGDPVIIIGDLPGTMRLVAGIPDSAGADVGPIATETALNLPRGLAVDDAGVVYIADYGARRVLSVTSGGQVREVVRDAGCRGLCPGRPLHLALAPDGTLVYSDNSGHRVMRLDPASGTLTALTGPGPGSGADGTPAADGRVESPSGVAVASDGTIYVSERATHRVRIIGTDGLLGTLAGTGTAGFAGDGGPADLARLSAPAGLTIAGGFLYIADAGNERIRRVDLRTRTIETIAGSGVRGFGGDGGPALEAALKRPEGVAVGADGEALFIADAGNNRIRRVGLTTGLVETFAGSGGVAFNGTQNSAGATALANPYGVATTPFGILFISDTEHHLVWRTTVER